MANKNSTAARAAFAPLFTQLDLWPSYPTAPKNWQLLPGAY